MGSNPRSMILPAFILAVVLFRCNNPPETEVERNFDNQGNVEYVVSAVDPDPDDSISYISVTANNFFNKVGNEASIVLPIVSEENFIEATAYDNHAKPDPSPVTSSFTPLRQLDARDVIEDVFSGKAEAYTSLEKSVLMTLGNHDPFYVDYLGTREDGTNFVVNYVGHGKKLEEQLKCKAALDSFGIPALYLVRIPEEEIRDRMGDFLVDFREDGE